MNLLNTTALAFVAIPLFAASLVRRYLRLSHIKGPPTSGWSVLWLARIQFGGTLCNDLIDAVNKYGNYLTISTNSSQFSRKNSTSHQPTGPLMRLAPNWVLVSDPSEVRRIWNVRSGYQRSPWYQGFRLDPSKDNLISASDPKDHHRLRSKVIPGYSGKGLGNQEAIIDTNVLKLTHLINHKYLTTPTDGPKPLNGALVFQYFSQDVNSTIEFGHPFGYLDKNCDFHGIIAAFETLMPLTMALALFRPLLLLIKSPLAKPLLPKLTAKTGVGRLLGIVQSLVDERYAEKNSPNPTQYPPRPKDVLSSFISTSLTPTEVYGESLVHLLGGTDTTAMALRTTLFYLSTRPSAYRALQSEIDNFIRQNGATRPVISDAEAKKLPYLQATMKEGLRIWPPVTGFMAKISPKDDVICGKKVPAHTHVAWAVLPVMRNKALFGEDADVFEPGRWIDAAAAAVVEGEEGEAARARLKEMEGVQSMVFAGGSRWECLGRRLATVMMGKVLFEVSFGCWDSC